jgi:DNA polymerase V
MYLAKVAMDIVAKKRPADKDGVRIAELNEDSYKFLLWDHEPLTDFWHIGPGKARRLILAHMKTMGDVAERTQWDEEFFYRTFGIDGEILIDHAWGIEPVTMRDIKNYRSGSHSLSNGQVLPRPYTYEEARNVFAEMAEVLCSDMVLKNQVSSVFNWWVSYDYKSLEICPDYEGEVVLDYYGRLHPRHSNGTVRMRMRTNSVRLVTEALLPSFDAKTDHRLLYRRLGVCACDSAVDDGSFQLDLFTDYARLAREDRIQRAMLEVRRRYGAGAVFKGINLLEGATTLERNRQIGGHRA